MQIITESGAVLNDTNIVEESMTLQESICSESQLRFGCCEASVFKIRLIEQLLPVLKQKITVSMPYNEEVMQLGRYKIDSDKPTADRRYRDIVAYDAMYDIINAEVSAWYNAILPNADSTVTLKEFRDSFLAYFGIEQEEVELVNDSMTIEKTIEPSKLSGKTVATAICEINGCFGHIGRDGKFQYIFLKEMKEGLYPSNTLYPRDDLYPADPMNAWQISKSHYISAEYEDFTTERINKLQIRQEENDIGCIYGTGDNCYIVQDNFLVYGKSAEELKTIAANLYSVICKVWYRPAHVEAKGNPCLEVGDGIRLSTKYSIVYTYILHRTLKGIQALRDTYDADGEQFQSEKVNSVHEDIIQLKGKTNKLYRTIEETRLEIKDIESGLDSKITQTVQKIETEVTRAKSAEESLGSRITQTADSISSEVTRATNAESSLSSKINQTAEQIELKVSKGDVSSQLSIESGQVTLKSNRFVLDSTNCSISKEGNITANNVDLSGKITASSGKIGGFTIGSNGLTSGSNGSLSNPFGVYIGTDGISCGKSGAAFKVTNAGVLTIDSASGNITLGNINSGRMVLDEDGISFGTSIYTTEITKDKIKIFNTYIEKDTVHCAKYSSANTYYTDINGNSIELVGSSITNKVTFENSGISFGNSQTFSIESNAAGVIINNGNISINGDTKITIGGRHTSGIASQVLAFFGGTGSKKITVATATSSTILNQLNELINALKSYGLIG